jgi:hypothetical protein
MFGSNARKIKQLTEAVTLLLRIELQRQGVIASDVAVTLRGQAAVAQGSNASAAEVARKHISHDVRQYILNRQVEINLDVLEARAAQELAPDPAVFLPDPDEEILP